MVGKGYELLINNNFEQYPIVHLSRKDNRSPRPKKWWLQLLKDVDKTIRKAQCRHDKSAWPSDVYCSLHKPIDYTGDKKDYVVLVMLDIYGMYAGYINLHGWEYNTESAKEINSIYDL